MNENHYQRMIDAIELFQSHRVNLPDLINNLEALIDSLDGISDQLRNAFLARWGVVEDVYALAIYENRSDLTKEERDLINSALLEIKNAAMKRLE